MHFNCSHCISTCSKDLRRRRTQAQSLLPTGVLPVPLRHRLSCALVKGEKARFCSLHKTTSMIDVRSRRCQTPDCKRQPSYGYEGKRACFCAAHKEEGMVDVVSRRCEWPDCRRRPLYGFEVIFFRFVFDLHSKWCSDFAVIECNGIEVQYSAVQYSTVQYSTAQYRCSSASRHHNAHIAFLGVSALYPCKCAKVDVKAYTVACVQSFHPSLLQHAGAWSMSTLCRRTQSHLWQAAV